MISRRALFGLGAGGAAAAVGVKAAPATLGFATGGLAIGSTPHWVGAVSSDYIVPSHFADAIRASVITLNDVRQAEHMTQLDEARAVLSNDAVMQIDGAEPS
jgi:hypothetical protein